jgi:hypothetical protein
LLVATVVAAALVAALLDRPVWAAALGAGLALAYWALELAVWRVTRGRPGLALGPAIGGMIIRLGFVVVVLVAVGLLARPAFATAALSFLAAFSVYMVVRLFSYPLSAAEPPADRAKAA